MFGKRLKIKSAFTKAILGILLILLFFLRWQFLSPSKLSDGQWVRVTASITQEPTIFGRQQSFQLGEIVVWTGRYPEYHYGETVVVEGRLKMVPGKGLKRYFLSYPQITVIATGETGGIKGIAFLLKEKLKAVFNRSLRQPLDGILVGIILGDKSLISLDFWEKLKLTGTLHLMVASGMNISFLSAITLPLLALFVRRRVALLILIILIWFYSLLSGFQPPIIRASLMASLVYFGQLLGRETEGKRLLLFAGLLMVFVRPFYLFDLGFQLSFLASAGLVFLQPRLQEQDFFLFHQEAFASTIAAQLMTLPLLVGYFGQLNLISPLINLAVLWLIPGLLAGGILAGLLGLFSLWLGRLILFLFLPALFYLEQVINLSAKLTFFQLQLPKIGWGTTMIYYLLLAYYFRPKTRQSTINV